MKDVKYVGFESFRDCSSIPSILIPEGVIILEEESFYICSSAVSVCIESDIDGLLPRTFGYCSALKDVDMGDIISLGASEAEYMAAVNDMAAAALVDGCTATNPRTPFKDEVIEIYKKIW